MSDQDPIGLKDKPEFCRDKADDLQKVFAAESRLIAADAHLGETLFTGNGYELFCYGCRTIQVPVFRRINNLMPRPAKQTPQAAANAVGSCDSAIETSRAKTVIFSQITATNNLCDIFRLGNGVIHLSSLQDMRMHGLFA